MSTSISEKELAYLCDLYVAPDWGERIAQLMADNLPLLKKGKILYVSSGTGAHALSIQKAVGRDVTLTCVDESEERNEIFRAKAQALKVQPQVIRGQLEALDLPDDEFDLIFADASMLASERLPEVVDELARLVAPGGTIGMVTATSASFGEFFSVYWEALLNLAIEDHEHDVEDLIKGLPTASDVEQMFAEDLTEVSSWTRNEEFKFESGRQFIESPLVSGFLLNQWLESLPDEEARARITEELVRIIDENRSDMAFTMSLKATLVVGKKEV